jgi:hypothetical protein
MPVTIAQGVGHRWSESQKELIFYHKNQKRYKTLVQ